VTVTTIMVPFVISGMMLAVQVGLAYHAQQVASGAAQDGAATAAREGSSVAIGVATAKSLVHGSAGNLLHDISVEPSEAGDTVTVTVSGAVVRVLPIGPTFRVSASSAATFERFRAQGPVAEP